jgi:hypothetical protein
MADRRFSYAGSNKKWWSFSPFLQHEREGRGFQSCRCKLAKCSGFSRWGRSQHLVRHRRQNRSRVFHSPDRGQTWQVFDAPIVQGPDSAGIFSIAFRDPLHGVIAGGDYKRPKADGPNLAFTSDGGKTWTLSDITPQAYFSAVAYDAKFEADAVREQAAQEKEASAGRKIRIKPVPPQRLFIIGPDFIFDFRPPLNPRHIGGKKKEGYTFNAVSPFPDGGALIVGPKGTIAYIP